MRTFWLTVLAATIASPSPAQSRFLADHPDVASRIELFERWVEAQMRYQRQPGVSIGIVLGQEL